jgi:hypothetical protein
MSRRENLEPIPPDDQAKLDPETERQAQEFVHDLLTNEGFRRPYLEVLNRPVLARELANLMGLGAPLDAAARIKFKRALERGDRSTLLHIVRQSCVKHPIPPGTYKAVRTLQNPVVTANEAKKALKSVLDDMKQKKPGPPQLILQSEYGQLVARADSLFPVILEVLERFPSSKRTVEEHLEFMQRAHPDACMFLLKYVDDLKKLLDDEQPPAKKLKTRAHRIAGALAGRDYGLLPSTSFAYVSQERRLSKKTSDLDFANN